MENNNKYLQIFSQNLNEDKFPKNIFKLRIEKLKNYSGAVTNYYTSDAGQIHRRKSVKAKNKHKYYEPFDTRIIEKIKEEEMEDRYPNYTTYINACKKQENKEREWGR